MVFDLYSSDILMNIYFVKEKETILNPDEERKLRCTDWEIKASSNSANGTWPNLTSLMKYQKYM